MRILIYVLPITPAERTMMINQLVDQFVSNMFNNGQDEDYARNGFPDHVGFEHFTDKELVNEYNEQFPEEASDTSKDTTNSSQ